MASEGAKYDVAISFLSRDENIANAIYQKLSHGLKVFFYPRSQEDLVGTNGLESMRQPFYDGSRVVVILYRRPWGETPWTRVEQTAIQERCLKFGFDRRLIFVMLDAGDPPQWLPQNFVRFNYSDFGLDEAVGAIKARAQEAGGTIERPSAIKQAQLYRAEAEYEARKRELLSPTGWDRVQGAAVELFRRIEAQQQELSEAAGALMRFGAQGMTAVITNNRVSLALNQRVWTEQGMPLMVREFDNRVPLPGTQETYLYFPDGEPKIVRETSFLPHLNRSGDVGWTTGSEFFSPSDLAERIMIQFIELVRRSDLGEFRRKVEAYGTPQVVRRIGKRGWR